MHGQRSVTTTLYSYSTGDEGTSKKLATERQYIHHASSQVFQQEHDRSDERVDIFFIIGPQREKRWYSSVTRIKGCQQQEEQEQEQEG